jgi:hypothetical protein
MQPLPSLGPLEQPDSSLQQQELVLLPLQTEDAQILVATFAHGPVLTRQCGLHCGMMVLYMLEGAFYRAVEHLLLVWLHGMAQQHGS